MRVVLKNNKEITCDGSDDIIRAGLNQNIYLPHSCLSGRCSSCKAKVLSGVSEARYPEIGLTPREKEEGYILTCVHIPKTDMLLDIKDMGETAFFPVGTYPAKIKAIDSLSDTIVRLELRFPPRVNFKFIPGQYINILREEYKRSYSVANVSEEDGLVLFVKKYEGGRFSQYIFNDASVNDLLRVEGPFGTFIYQQQPKKNIIFLATGTGMAPVRSILGHLKGNDAERSQLNIWVFYGTRHGKDLIWEKDNSLVDCSFIPVLSSPTLHWNGEKGYVQDVALKYVADFSHSVVFACGSEAMIHAAFELLTENGLEKEDFHADAFVITS